MDVARFLVDAKLMEDIAVVLLNMRKEEVVRSKPSEAEPSQIEKMLQLWTQKNYRSKENTCRHLWKALCNAQKDGHDTGEAIDHLEQLMSELRI